MTTGKKKIEIAIIVLFAVLTLTILAFHTPFWDEAHAFTIARTFNLFDLFRIEKYEGHLFIWYLMQMPFAKTNFFYPYSIFLLNWLCAFLFVLVLWKKAPFSTLEKTFITFSFPVFFYFAIIARCYSVGILFLFLALAFYKERFKRPYIISLLLILAANTSAMTAIISLILGIILLFELILKKEYKKCALSALILLSGAFIAFIQIKGASHPALFDYENTFFPKVKEFFSFNDFFKTGFAGTVNKILSLCTLILYIVSFYYMRKTPIPLFFLISHLVIAFWFFSKIYIGNWWHYLFFFIWIIIAVWVSRMYENKSGKFLTFLFNFSFRLLLFMMFFKTLIFPFDFYPACYNTDVREDVRAIKAFGYNNPEKYKIYFTDLLPRTSIGVIPYFKDLKIYNIFGNDKYSILGFKDNFHYIKSHEETDYMIDSFDKQKTNLLFADDSPPEIIVGKKYTLFLTPIYKSRRSNFKIYNTSYKINE